MLISGPQKCWTLWEPLDTWNSVCLRVHLRRRIIGWCPELVLPCRRSFSGSRAMLRSVNAGDQDASYCHRFTLASMLAKRILEDHPGSTVRVLALDCGAYACARKANQLYMPRSDERRGIS
jgi:hypothetical protein